MTIKDHIINALASAAAIGAATTLVGLKINDARQDTRIERLETLDASVQGLRVDIRNLDVHLSHLDGQVQSDELHNEDTHHQ